MRLRRRIAAIAGATVFLVLAGGLNATALWNVPASVTTGVQAASFADACTRPTSLTNASFENPQVASRNSVTFLAGDALPGWRWTNASGSLASAEVWPNGHEGVTTPAGTQFVELNAEEPGSLSQTIDTTPGQTLEWSFLHRGRQGTDRLQVFVGAENTSGSVQGAFATGQAWQRHSGAYVVPAGQTRTTLRFSALEYTASSIGNFLDDISFGSGPCLTTRTAFADVNGGTYRVGDIVEVTSTITNIGSGLASDSRYSVALPAGFDYVPGSLVVDGASRSDAPGDDQAVWDAASRTVRANVGPAATAMMGGGIAPTVPATVRFRAVAQISAADTTVRLDPAASYVSALAPNWGFTAKSNPSSFRVDPAADVSVVMSTTTPRLQRDGGTQAASWTATVRNDGPSAATGVQLTLRYPSSVPQGTAPVGAGMTCTAPANTNPRVITCVIPELAAGDTRTMTLTRSVPTDRSWDFWTGMVTPGPYRIDASVTAAVHDHVTANNVSQATVTVVADATPPTTPASLTASNVQTGRATLTWTASTDAGGSGLAVYRLYRDQQLIASTTAAERSVTVTGLAPGTTYAFDVEAVDGEGNVSPRRSTTVTTRAQFSASNLVTIRNSQSGLCIDAAGSVTADGAQLRQLVCSATPSQRFRIIPTSGENVVFQPADSASLVWTVPLNATGSVNLDDSRPLQLSTRVNPEGAHQQFRIEQTADGRYRLIMAGSPATAPRCVDINGGSRDADAQVQQYQCNGTPAQDFAITQVFQ